MPRMLPSPISQYRLQSRLRRQFALHHDCRNRTSNGENKAKVQIEARASPSRVVWHQVTESAWTSNVVRLGRLMPLIHEGSPVTCHASRPGTQGRQKLALGFFYLTYLNMVDKKNRQCFGEQRRVPTTIQHFNFSQEDRVYRCPADALLRLIQMIENLSLDFQRHSVCCDRQLLGALYLSESMDMIHQSS